MSNTSLQEALETTTQMAREAGRRIMPFFQAACAHELKADHSPVSEADLASHTYLMEALAALPPVRPVISEESAEVANQIQADEYWLIDPLDGTKEFLKGRPHFTVNIALIRDRRPVLGVVYAPALDLTYGAVTGCEAWRQQGAGARETIRTRGADFERVTVVASKDHCGPRVKKLLEHLPAPAVTNIGSSLKFCLVAEGRADLYFRDLPTMEWDTAAAQCVAEAAGGQVLALDGTPFQYGKPGLRNEAFLVVGDPAFPWHKLAPGQKGQMSCRSFFAGL